MNESVENKCETKRDLGMNSYIVLDSTNLTRKIQENLSKLNSLKLTSHQKTCNWNEVQPTKKAELRFERTWVNDHRHTCHLIYSFFLLSHIFPQQMRIIQIKYAYKTGKQNQLNYRNNWNA